MFHLRTLLRTAGSISLRRFCSQDLKYRIHESIRNVDPYSTVQISCSLNAIIRPLDLFEYPDSNQLRILAFSDSADSTVQIEVKRNGEGVEINEHSDQNGKTNCIFEVPVKCDLKMRCKQGVTVSELYSDYIDVQSKGHISTKNLRCTSVSLTSEDGNITCDGLTLAQEIAIKGGGKGNIHLDKIQGNLLECTSSEGRISTNSCYAEQSKFVTERGAMNLKNIHKKSAVYVLEKADVHMTGIHGSLLVKMNAGNLNLQFSELVDENIVMSNDSRKVSISISDVIEETCFVDLHSDEIALDESALHLQHCLQDNRFRVGRGDCRNKLLAYTSGQLTVAKSSWADSLKASMALKKL